MTNRGVKYEPAQVGGGLAEMDAWCVKQMAKLSDAMSPYLMAGGSTDDPQYRQQLGQHQAFMRMRSFIHGSLAQPQSGER